MCKFLNLAIQITYFNNWIYSQNVKFFCTFQFDEGSRFTDARRVTSQTVAILKEAADPNSDISKKVEELLKKGK